MMKFKGVVYPVSVYKFTIADEIADRLDYIRVRMGNINGNEVIALCINTTYKLCIAAEKAEEELKESEVLEVKENGNKPF